MTILVATDKNNSRKWLRLCLFVMFYHLLFGSGLVRADAAAPDDATGIMEDDSQDVFPGNVESGAYTDSPFFDILDKPRIFLAKNVESLVRSLDEFFANQKTTYASTGSFAQLSLDTIWNEGGKIGYVGNVNLKLQLPATQNKLKFLLESNPEETRNILDVPMQNTPKDAVQQPKYFAGLLTTVGHDIGWQFEPSAGVRLSAPLDVFARIRAIKSVDFDDWKMTVNNSLYWYNSTGTGDDVTLEFSRRLRENLLFRSTSSSRWTKHTDYFILGQVFSLTDRLSPRRAVVYSIGVYGSSERVLHITDYLLSAQYRQALHRENLFVSLIPALRFEQVSHFHDEYTLTLRLEWLLRD